VALPEGALDGKIAFVDLRLYRTQDASGYDNTVAVRSERHAEALGNHVIAGESDLGAGPVRLF
jgi:hypothetical protein